MKGVDPLRPLPPRSELLTRNQEQSPSLIAEFLPQVIQSQPEVVISDNEEVVVVIVIPSGHLTNRTVPIRGVGVSVEISFEPIHGYAQSSQFGQNPAFVNVWETPRLGGVKELSMTRNILLAYIDPGTGSILLQALLGGIAGLAVFLKTTGRRLFRRRPQEPAETTDS